MYILTETVCSHSYPNKLIWLLLLINCYTNARGACVCNVCTCWVYIGSIHVCELNREPTRKQCVIIMLSGPVKYLSKCGSLSCWHIVKHKQFKLYISKFLQIEGQAAWGNLRAKSDLKGSEYCRRYYIFNIFPFLDQNQCNNGHRCELVNNLNSEKYVITGSVLVNGLSTFMIVLSKSAEVQKTSHFDRLYEVRLK